MDRQDDENCDENGQLQFQITTTNLGGVIMDKVISHDFQWLQLNEVLKTQVAHSFLTLY